MSQHKENPVRSQKLRKNTINKKCLFCGITFVIPKCRDWREHCCSSACKVAHRKLLSAQLKRSRTRKCKQCRTKFVVKKSQIDAGHGKYCSNACARADGALDRAVQNAHTPEARAKSVATLRKSIRDGKVVTRSGEENPNWRGGYEEAVRRHIESGKRNESIRKYRAENPHKAREFRLKRRGRAIGRLPRGTISQRFVRQRNKCAVCRASLKKLYHVDHIMPLALGGAHEPNNIQLLCPPCNVRKGYKHPIRFMQERGFLI